MGCKIALTALNHEPISFRVPPVLPTGITKSPLRPALGLRERGSQRTVPVHRDGSKCWQTHGEVDLGQNMASNR